MTEMKQNICRLLIQALSLFISFYTLQNEMNDFAAYSVGVFI